MSDRRRRVPQPNRRRRVPELLATAPDGCPEALMLGARHPHAALDSSSRGAAEDCAAATLSIGCRGCQ